MARIVYCRGHFIPESEACISVFDRGFLFGDSIYEVTAVINGRLIDNDLHLTRLERSLGALNIPMPATRTEIERIQAELIVRNHLTEGTVYLQVSRGEADRAFLYPKDLQPSFVAFTQSKKLIDTPAQQNGISIDLATDPRWIHRDVKTTMLLGQVLVKQEASEHGFTDVWMVQDGLITEGASSTAFIVTRDNRIQTRPDSQSILPGCTRKAIARLCEEHGLSLDQRAFSPAEAQASAEAFLTSASSLVTPVVKIGEATIGDGQPGSLTRHLQSYYLEAALSLGQCS
jgi:D-alanine transaminase